MTDIAGYARLISNVRCKQQATKPLIGKTTLRYGQCLITGAYMFALGAVLAESYSHQHLAFGHAFLGAKEETPGALAEFYNELCAEYLLPRLEDGSTFLDVVQSLEAERTNFPGDASELLLRGGLTKVEVENATGIVLGLARYGAALGFAEPEIARRVCEASFAKQDPADWERARNAVVDLPPEQDVLTWSDFLEAERPLFLAYCEECCPQHLAVLTA